MLYIPGADRLHAGDVFQAFQFQWLSIHDREPRGQLLPDVYLPPHLSQYLGGLILIVDKNECFCHF